MTQNLVPKNEEKRFILQTSYMLSCPIICFSGFEETVTPEQREKYRLEAMLHCVETFEKEEACDYHCMLYLSHATLVAKPDQTFGHIYLWLSTQYWGDKMPEDIRYTQDLDENEKWELEKFRKWIFKNQIEGLKAKFK